MIITTFDILFHSSFLQYCDYANVTKFRKPNCVDSLSDYYDDLVDRGSSLTSCRCCFDELYYCSFPSILEAKRMTIPMMFPANAQPDEALDNCFKTGLGVHDVDHANILGFLALARNVPTASTGSFSCIRLKKSHPEPNLPGNIRSFHGSILGL